MKLARQLSSLGTETAFAVSALADARQQQGHRVYPFHLGDINIPPAPAFATAIQRAIADGKNGYCPGAGTPLLREQLARWISEERDGVAYTADEIAVQPGGKPVIAKFLAAVMNDGDAVLTPRPGFPIYESQIRYQGGEPIPYYYRRTADGQFALDMDDLRAAVSPTTRALIYNNYHNPSGAAGDAAELDAVAELAQRHDLAVLADEAYFRIRYDETPPQTLLSRAGMKERTVLLFTCSKQFAMTGWRLGAACAPPPIAAAIAKMNTNLESCTTHFVQHAVATVLRDGEAESSALLATLDKRRRLLCARLNAIDGIQVRAPASAFYVYCDVAEIVARKGLPDADALMQATLEATGVSFCTGTHFGDTAGNYIRLAFSGISSAAIEAGMAELKTYFEHADKTTTGK